MNLTVTHTGRGHFSASVGGRVIVQKSDTPFFCAARVLLREGVSPSEPLTMTHKGSEVVCLTSTVGRAARWTVEDSDKGVRYRPYKPSPYAKAK